MGFWKTKLSNDNILQELVDKLEDKESFIKEWAQRTARDARRNARAKGSGGGFWEQDVAGSVKLVSVGSDSFVVKADSAAAIHKHFGGTVTAKNAGALTIPLHEDAKGKRAGEFQDLFIVKPKKSKFAFLARDNDPGLQFMYLLCKRVTHKAEPWWPSDADIAKTGYNVAKKHLEKV